MSEGTKEGKQWRITIYRNTVTNLWGVECLHKPTGRIVRMKSKEQPAESHEDLAAIAAKDLRRYSEDIARFSVWEKCKGK